MNKNRNKGTVAVALMTTLSMGLGVVAPFQGVTEAHASTVTATSSQQVKEATVKVQVAEYLRFTEYTNTVYNQVNSLPNSPIKTDLLKRLANLKNQEGFTTAHNRLDMVERYRSVNDLDYAKKLTNGVTHTTMKGDLQKRINISQDRISFDFAMVRLLDASRYLNEEDLSLIRNDIGKINETYRKADATKNLEKVSDRMYFETVLSLVDSADYTRDLELVSKAKSYTFKIKDARMKYDASKQIANVEKKIKSTVSISVPYDKAYRAVKWADAHSTTHNVAYAKAKVKEIKDVRVKAELEKRLILTEEKMNLELLHERIELLQRTKHSTDLAKSKALLSKLSSKNPAKPYVAKKIAEVEDEMMLRDSRNRMDNIKNLESFDVSLVRSNVSKVSNPVMKKELTYDFAKLEQAYNEQRAEKYVRAVEKSKLMSDFKVAKDVVSKLKPSSMKSSLDAKLKALEKVVR